MRNIDIATCLTPQFDIKKRQYAKDSELLDCALKRIYAILCYVFPAQV